MSSSQSPRPYASRFLAYLDNLQRFGIRPGLERVRALLARAGDPQLSYPVVLVGGTNGKGSTCEFLAQSLAAEGRRVGLYTSPHLHAWNERIRVLTPEEPIAMTGQTFPDAISDEELDTLFGDALPHLEAVAAEHGQPTEFETLTFLGLWHFARCKVDIAVVEVGLGGRWDATNVCEPVVSVITHVALDHCDRLGNTFAEIASDKVCIARPNRILVTADTKDDVLAVFHSYCDQISARLWPFRDLSGTNGREANAVKRSLEVLRNSQPATDNAPFFQILNAQTAGIARLALQEELGWPMRVAPSPGAVAGRVEQVRDSPIVLLDGANNPDGATQLAIYLNIHYEDKNVIFVCGISADKNWRSMIETWAPLALTIITTQADHPRAASATDLSDHASRFCQHVEAIDSVPSAVQRALEIAAPEDVICICGSFFVLAEVDRDAIRNFKK